MRRPIRRERMRDMTRSAAREIAVHFTFELGFSDLSADQLLERDLTPEFFALLGEEEPLYAQFPDKIQLEYIQKIVRGVFAHGAELARMGLGVPAMTRVFHRLRAMGVDIDPSVYTVEQARDAILAKLDQGPHKAGQRLCGEGKKEPADMEFSASLAENGMEHTPSDEGKGAE